MKLQSKFAIMLLLILLVTTLMPITAFALEGAGDVKLDSKGNLELSGDFTDKGSVGAWNDFIAKYRLAISGLSGVGAVTFLVFFIIQFMKLGASAGNSMKRSEALSGLIWTGIATAGLGGVGIFIGFFYNALKDTPPAG